MQDVPGSSTEEFSIMVSATTRVLGTLLVAFFLLGSEAHHSGAVVWCRVSVIT